MLKLQILSPKSIGARITAPVSKLRSGLRRRPAASPPAVRKGFAFPLWRSPTNLLRAAGRHCLPAARRRRKRGAVARKGGAFPHSKGRSPINSHERSPFLANSEMTATADGVERIVAFKRFPIRSYSPAVLADYAVPIRMACRRRMSSAASIASRVASCMSRGSAESPML